MDIKELRKLINEVKKERKLLEEAADTPSDPQALMILKVLMELSPEKLQEKIEELSQKGHRSHIAGVSGIINNFKALAKLGQEFESVKLPKPADQMIDDPQFKSLDSHGILTAFYDLNMLDTEKYFHPVDYFLKFSAQSPEQAQDNTQSENPQNSTNPDSPAGMLKKGKPTPVDPNATTITRKK
jgi:hypothetical protein